MPPSVSSPFREPQADSHAEVKGRFLVQPDLARQIVDELLDELIILFAHDLFEALNDFFLPLYVRRCEQLIVVQRLEEFVVLVRALLLDVAEARISNAVLRNLDALRSRARDIHQIVRRGAHHCLQGSNLTTSDLRIQGSTDL